MITSSPGSRTAINAMYRQCLPPAPVVMFSGLYGRLFSRLNLSAMACRSSGRQGVGVYFVCPLSSAIFAASLMNAGVSKSGSPAPKPTTSTPAFLSALALALTASVIESETRLIRSASEIMTTPKSELLRAGNGIGAADQGQMALPSHLDADLAKRRGAVRPLQ